jgi:DNA-binding NarL/FixJ family response regulator
MAERDGTAVVVDMWALLRLGACDLLRGQGLTVTADVASLDEALHALREDPPTLVVAGWPAGATVLEAVRQIKSRPEPPTVIALVPHGDRGELVELVRGGADGVIDRAGDPSEFSDAVARVLAGERVVAASLHRALVANMQAGAPARTGSALTAKERAVLALLAGNRTNKEIAEAMFVSTATVKTHLTRIFTKLEVRTRTEAVARAVELQLLD